MHIWQHLYDFVLFARRSRDGGLQLVRQTGELLWKVAPGRRVHVPRAWSRQRWVWVDFDGVLRHPSHMCLAYASREHDHALKPSG
jgi:hypothetical protein